MKQAVSYYCKGARLGDGNCARRLVKLLKSARRACCQGTGVQRCAQCQQMQLALKEAKKSHPGVLLREGDDDDEASGDDDSGDDDEM